MADVLENMTPRSVLPHLGDLASIWLYHNDRQIKKIHYREVPADEARYQVTIRRLDTAAS